MKGADQGDFLVFHLKYLKLGMKKSFKNDSLCPVIHITLGPLKKITR